MFWTFVFECYLAFMVIVDSLVVLILFSFFGLVVVADAVYGLSLYSIATLL